MGAPDLADALAKFRAAADAMAGACEGPKQTYNAVHLAKQATLFVRAAGDLAVHGIEAYAAAVAEDRKAAEANRDAERAALGRAESNAIAMKWMTVVIALAAIVQASAVVVQIVRPTPAPVVTVSVPAQAPPPAPARDTPTPKATPPPPARPRRP